MAGVDDIIKQWVARAERTGELRNGKYWGKPFDQPDGYWETPEQLRMGHRILKNAGYVPAEVEMLKELAALKERLADAADDAPAEDVRALRRRIAALELKVNMLLERIRTTK